MLVKVIGSILIVTCGVAFGMNEKMKFLRKIGVLKGVIAAIDLIHAEISCMCTPTDELLEKLCATENETLCDFFTKCRDLHKERYDLPLGLIWSKVLKGAVNLDFGKNEEQTMGEIGNALGRYEVCEQLKVFQNARINFTEYLDVAEKSKEILGRLYGSLSIIAGIALVVILL
ncbi:MAG: stage III sporulation protein AB [Clostridia bacterium]|nr:stage III sporulation protein AB [Clostridia bacterium]